MTGSESVLNVQDTAGAGPDRAQTLRDAGFAVVDAANAAEALQLIGWHEVAVAVLDAAQAGLLTDIRELSPRTLVLLVQANSDDGLGDVLADADGFLRAPIRPLELAASVRALLRLHRADEELRDFNETLELHIAERTRELAETNAELRREIADRARVEAALIQAQKMEAVGYLTGGIAHDFNNLLTAIVGGLDLIRRRVPDEKLRMLADNALQAANRGARLTGRLLAFSRSQTLSPVPVDVDALIRGMGDLLAQTLGQAVALELRPDAAAGLALADPGQLELALLNVVANARDALPEAGGRIEVSTRPWAVTVAEPDLPVGDYVAIEVTDTGCGMSEQVAARAFDPFYTTKGAGQGTGLGLSQVYGVARQLGGTARIESAPDQGTTVRILLRRAPAAPAVVPEADAPAEGGETLLVVDDDNDVRMLLVAQLADLGYRIVEASSGASALALFEEAAPRLALLDFSMPGMNGAELAERLLELEPGLPIVFTSGYADLDILSGAVASASLLRKPFRTQELADIVRTTLEHAKRD